jgi:hypothetical protein
MKGSTQQIPFGDDNQNDKSNSNGASNNGQERGNRVSRSLLPFYFDLSYDWGG